MLQPGPPPVLPPDQYYDLSIEKKSFRMLQVHVRSEARGCLVLFVFSYVDPFTYLCFSIQFSSATVMAAKCAAHHEYSDFLIPQCIGVAPLVLAKVVFGLYGAINGP